MHEVISCWLLYLSRLFASVNGSLEQKQQHASSRENKQDHYERGQPSLHPKLFLESDSTFLFHFDVFSAQLNPLQPVFHLADPRVSSIASTSVIHITVKVSDGDNDWEPLLCVAPKHNKQ